MKINPINKNYNEVEINNIRVLFSYKTCVAACIDRKYYKTSTRWSNTTSRHISKWVGGADVEEKPQEFFDDLIGNQAQKIT